MVRPIRNEPMHQPENAKRVDDKKVSQDLKKGRDSISNLVVNGRLKSSLGAGNPPVFSKQAPGKQLVAKAVKNKL